MNRDAQLVRTCHSKRLAGRLFVFALLLANLFYSTLAFAQIVGSGNLNIERRSHTATLLENGRVLIIGGDNQNGVVSQAEIFDSVSRISTLAAASLTPRTDHSASILLDGRVLVIGGRDQSAALDSTEIYNPLTSSFVAGPPMMRARSGHTATPLSNGKILVTGGDLFGSAEIYDPLTQSFSLVIGSLNTPRKFHSAASLHNGQVMIVGGVDAQNTILNTAEIYDPATQSFYHPVNGLRNPRALATLRLLPDGKVQIIGGDSDLSMEIFDPQEGLFNGVALLPPNTDLLVATLSNESRVALISPMISQDPFLNGILTAEQLALLERADHSVTELPESNQALVAGGLKSTGQVLSSAALVKSSSATVTTDKTDYAPGQIVTITGTAWRPGERVKILFHEFPEEYPDIVLFGVADQQGKFVIAEFAPQLIDIGRTFTLTAIGETSGFTAQTAFTDAPRISSVTVGSQTGILTYGTAGSATYTVTPVRGNNGSVNGTLSVTSGLPTGVTWSFSPSATWNTTGNNPFPSRTLTLTTSAATPSGTFTFTVRAADGSDAATNTGTITINKAAATITLSNITQTYTGSALMPSATTTPNGLAIVWTNAPQTNAGSYAVTATVDDANYQGSTKGTFLINKGNPVITWANPADITYPTALSGTQLNASADVPGSFAYTPVSGTVLNAGSNQDLRADFTPSDTANYNSAFKIVKLNVNKANQTIFVSQSAVSAAMYNTTFSVAATGGASGNPVVITTSGACIVNTGGNNSATILMISGIGICTVEFKQVGNANYHDAPVVTQTTNAISWTLHGFYQPVDMSPSAPASIVWNSVKGGSTIPLKFKIFAGSIELKDIAAVKSLSAMFSSCGGGMDVPIDELSATGGTSLRYDMTGGQFIFNWQTSKGANNCYRVTMTTQDGSSLSAYFKTK
jgi:hypothetical protein